MFRACIYVSGSTTEFLYSEKQEALLRRAIKALTRFQPGCASLWPDRIEIQRKIGTLSGKRSLWETVQIIRYENLTHDQHYWRKRP